MLTLLLLRHAKSSWEDTSLDDFDRPLSDRGRQAAPSIARAIAAYGLQPDLILCSSAARTQQTLALVLPVLSGAAPAIRFEDDLYLATASSLLARLKRVPSRWKRVMLVGHNPGLHDLAVKLAGGGEPAALRLLVEKLPTAGLAVLTFDLSQWSDVAARTGKLSRFITPRSLKG